MAITKEFSRITPENLTPDHVRGLRLGETTRMFGTLGLIHRFKDETARNGLAAEPDVNWSYGAAMTLHANQRRTNGHYKDHILRVSLRPMVYWNIVDPTITGGTLLHDSVEDHAKLFVYMCTGIWESDERIARERCFELIAERASQSIAEMVEVVTNPILEEGQDKNQVHFEHTRDVIIPHRDGRVGKASDFVDNAVGNHYTIGEKQEKGDRKYLDEYQLHQSGLFLPDSRIVGEPRDLLLAQLDEGHARALARLSLIDAA